METLRAQIYMNDRQRITQHFCGESKLIDLAMEGELGLVIHRNDECYHANLRPGKD